MPNSGPHRLWQAHIINATVACEASIVCVSGRKESVDSKQVMMQRTIEILSLRLRQTHGVTADRTRPTVGIQQ